MFYWGHVISLEGDELTSVSLLPYEQSLLLTLLGLLKCSPEQFLIDIEEIDIDDFRSKITEIEARLTINV